MATQATWTVVFDDKTIIKQNGDGAGPHEVVDNAFWSDSKFSNIWAIQYGNSNVNDEVEYRDGTPHSSFADANLGNIQDFIDKWDAAHLAELQENWDNDHYTDDEGVVETPAEKIVRLGARPTSYSS